MEMEVCNVGRRKCIVIGRWYANGVRRIYVNVETSGPENMEMEIDKFRGIGTFVTVLGVTLKAIHLRTGNAHREGNKCGG